MLRVLRDDPDHAATIDELVTHLIDRETQRTGERPARDQLEMVIHHVHLPKLTDAGVVEYNARSQELHYWPHERLEDLLDHVTQWEPA